MPCSRVQQEKVTRAILHCQPAEYALPRAPAGVAHAWRTACKYAWLDCWSRRLTLLWVNRTALVKPGEKPEERPSAAAPLLPFSIRGRLLRDASALPAA